MSLLEIRVPAEQEGTRSQVLRWLKRPGEAVRENEPVVELETDKVTVEVSAPASGMLREILKQEGEELAPGDILARIDSGAAAGTATEIAASDWADEVRPGAGARAGAVKSRGVSAETSTVKS